jgi:hypothetical protein
MKVKLIKAHQNLTINRVYYVIGISGAYYRLLNDPGEPYLYPSEKFEVVDATEPEDWVVALEEDGSKYAAAPPLNEVGFFEDYFDRVFEAQRAFWAYIDRVKDDIW